MTNNNLIINGTLPGKYFITLPQAIRQVFIKNYTSLEALFTALVLSELNSLRFVQREKASQFKGSFLASISDIEFYTGISPTEIIECLKRLEKATMIEILNDDISVYTDENYHHQYCFKLNDNVIKQFVDVAEPKFIETKTQHVKDKIAAKPVTTTNNVIDAESFFTNYL